MKKLVLFLLATVALVWAQSASITIPALEITDAAQIRGLSFVTKNHNDAAQAAHDSAQAALPVEERSAFVPLTREQYAQKVLKDALNSWAKAEADALYAKAQKIYQEASAEGQSQILQSLGLADRSYGFQ